MVSEGDAIEAALFLSHLLVKLRKVSFFIRKSINIFHKLPQEYQSVIPTHTRMEIADTTRMIRDVHGLIKISCSLDDLDLVDDGSPECNML